MYDDRKKVKTNEVKLRFCDYTDNRLEKVRDGEQRAVAARKAFDLGLEIMMQEYLNEHSMEGPKEGLQYGS